MQASHLCQRVCGEELSVQVSGAAGVLMQTGRMCMVGRCVVPRVLGQSGFGVRGWWGNRTSKADGVTPMR